MCSRSLFHFCCTLLLPSKCILIMHMQTFFRPITHVKETYYASKRDLPRKQKRPTTQAKETYYKSKRDLLRKQKRTTTQAKEAYHTRKRDLLHKQKRPRDLLHKQKRPTLLHKQKRPAHELLLTSKRILINEEEDTCVIW